jgi:hypothetical protein
MLEEDKSNGDLEVKDNLDSHSSKKNALRELITLLVLAGLTLIYCAISKFS